MGILLDAPVRVKSQTLLVPLVSWLYLQDKSHFERCGSHHTEKQVERLTRCFKNSEYQGMKRLFNGDLGGCIGPVENAWEERRWTSWSVEDMIRFLEEAGLPWKRGADSEYIAI